MFFFIELLGSGISHFLSENLTPVHVFIIELPSEKIMMAFFVTLLYLRSCLPLGLPYKTFIVLSDEQGYLIVDRKRDDIWQQKVQLDGGICVLREYV